MSRCSTIDCAVGRLNLNGAVLDGLLLWPDHAPAKQPD